MSGESKIGFAILFSHRRAKLWVLADVQLEQAVHFKVTDIGIDNFSSFEKIKLIV